MSRLLETLRHLSSHPEYVNLRELSHLHIELKYATTDNFMGRNVYAEFNEPFLHRLAADKLGRAATLLQSARPGWKLLVFDALRPRSVQRLLWAHVEGTENEAYVAHPDRGSMHNYGCAIDLTLKDDSGREVDMGTPFDTFTELSQPKLETLHLQTGLLNQEHVNNRLILREAMTGAGFLQLPHEWWHYDAFPGDETRAKFSIIE
jgi:D-alanyl-D-alanine dipeptidase